MRKLLKKSQAKGLTLRRRKLFQRASQCRGSVGVPDFLGLARTGLRDAREPLTLRVGLDLRTAALPAQLVGNAKVSNLQQPGPNRSALRVIVGALFQTARNTSCTMSSAVGRPSASAAIPRTVGA